MAETQLLYENVRQTLREYPGPEARQPHVAGSMLVHHASVQRNKRCMLAYVAERAARLRGIRWDTGSSILPPEVETNLSPQERDLFDAYGKCVLEYQQELDIDLMADLQPPKELLITVRCLKDLGELVTESGTLQLVKGSQHLVRRSDVEALIRQGQLEHIME